MTNCPHLTVVERLRGCPDGATEDALLLNGHSLNEIAKALCAGEITREVRTYAKPNDFCVVWYRNKEEAHG